MTPRTPATEAGRALLALIDNLGNPYGGRDPQNARLILAIEAAARADAEQRVAALREALEVAADRLETMPDYPPEAVRQAAYFGSEDARYALAALDAMEATE
jgi:hypothetical protein